MQLVFVFEFLVVRQGVLPLPGGPLVLCPDQGIDLVEFRGRPVGVPREQCQIVGWPENRLGTQTEVHIHRRTKLQIGEQIHLSKDVPYKAVGGPSVERLGHLVQGIHNVAVDVIGVRKGAVVACDRCDRVDVQGPHHGRDEFTVLRQGVPFDVGEVDVLTHAEAIACLLLRIHAEGRSLKTPFFPTNDAVLAKMTHAHRRTRRCGSIRVQHTVVGHWGALEQFLLPICALPQ